ncbi:MAG TPA: sn-glycerol-3-phosphate ABC transporter ATP-binding protein UgpC [Pseudoneobacillus sp.]|nr:sn-glycerol-3-phosphate ABC transporter ATP-binding protein UgpC [Pseudoneobacillus sp.]
MAKIIMKDLTKSYDGEYQAVKKVNLEINDNEFCVLLGPSGCGKTTLLRMIAGLESISDGDLYLDEFHMNEVLPKDRDIAMVFQSYALYPHMSVYKNMAFGLKMKKINKEEIHNRILNAASYLGLEEYLDRKPRALSGGQQQRVSLGRALVKKPKVFLMDEPLSNLDAKLRHQTRETIVKIHNDADATTIYVTHDQIEAMTMGTKIVVMNKGVIQQIGTPEEIYEKPTNKFVAGFIGSPAINLVDGLITNGSIHTKIGNFKLTEEQVKKLKKYENKNVVMGIRPEHILAEDDPKFEVIQNSKIELKAGFIERLGSESIINGYVNDERIVSKIRFNRPINTNDMITMSIDMDSLHFFDTETELAID